MPAFNDPLNFSLCAKYHQNNMLIFLPPLGDGRRQSAIVLPSPPALLCANQNILIRSLCTWRLQFCANLVRANLRNGKRKKTCLYLLSHFFFKPKDPPILPILECIRLENERAVSMDPTIDLLLLNGKSMLLFSSRCG